MQAFEGARTRWAVPPLTTVDTTLTTVDAYFAAGGVTTTTARRLHMSVRAVTYRLDRIKTLTGYDPTGSTDPA